MQFETFSLTIHKRQIWTINSALEECFIMLNRKSERVMVLRSFATCVCTRYGFHFTVLLISFAPPYYAHSYANHWSVAQRIRQRQKVNGKWGKTAIKKVAAPAYASSLRCRILKCPCELSTGFSPHNPGKKPVRRGGRRKRLSLAA